VIMTSFDKAISCIGWDDTDQARIDELGLSLDGQLDELIESLAEDLVQFKEAQSLTANTRYVQRLHGAIGEWLEGLLDGGFDETHIESRCAFVERALEIDLKFDDFLMLETFVRHRLGGDGALFGNGVTVLDKALCLDLALIHSCYTQQREAKMERELLDQFLRITGFSRSLYENLAEARGWQPIGLEQSDMG